MTKHGQGKRNQPTCKSDRKPRSATLGFQKPTTPQDRWERDLAKLHAWVETKSCMELFDDELDRATLECRCIFLTPAGEDSCDPAKPRRVKKGDIAHMALEQPEGLAAVVND